MPEIMKKLELIGRYERANDRLEEAGNEKAADMAYNRMWMNALSAAGDLVKLTGGKLEYRLALRMVLRHRAKVMEICRKVLA